MKRNISLDVLRGIAILIVVIHHANPDILPNLPELSGLFGFIYWFTRNIGWSGLDLFFILSGFLIGGILFSEIEKTSSINISRFLLSRGFKIWPSYLFFLLIAFMALNLPWVSNDSDGFSGSLTLLTHVFFLQNYIPPEHPYKFWNSAIGPAWSLAVEEHFYLLLPIILILIRGKLKKHLVQVLIILIISITALRIFSSLDEVRINSFKISHFRFDALFIGVLLNYLWRNNSKVVEWIKEKNLKLLYFCIPAIAMCHIFSRNSFPMFTLGFSALSISYAFLLILSFENWAEYLKNSRIARGLSNVGKWSYNIYLWHCLWPMFFRPEIADINRGLIEHGLPAVIIILINIFIYGAISLFIGFLMTKLIENSFLKLRNKFITTRFSPFKA